MQDNRLSPSIFTLLNLLILPILAYPTAALAAEEGSLADKHIELAEQALERGEYLRVAAEYRKAAEQSGNAEVARRATRIAFAYEFNDDALLAAKRWVRLDSKNDEAREFLAMLYFRLDDSRRARREFERLVKSSSEAPGDRLLSFVGNLSSEQVPEKADKLMRSLAKRYKDSASAHYAVAALALQAGDSAHAKARLARSIELEPDSVRPQLLYARALMFDGNKDDAIAHLAELIGESARPDPDARMELALIYMLTGRDDDALSQVNQVLLEQSGRGDALRLMAIINFRLERLDAAWDDFQDLLASGQYRMDAMYYLARILDYRKEFERAVRFYREVRAGSNTVFAQRRASALLAHELDDVPGALQLLDKFAASSPNNAVELVITKAQLLVSLGRYDEGLEVYDRAVEYRPNKLSTALGRAELLLRTGNVNMAISEYRRAVERWPDNAQAMNALGYTLIEHTDRVQEASALIKKALQNDPENVAIIDSMGWVLHKLARHKEALPYLEKAYAGFPDHEVAAHLVEVLAVLDRRDEALRILQASEKENPGSDLLHDVRARFFPEKSD
jgi:tetratricopeptide (TPR) repeat protein